MITRQSVVIVWLLPLAIALIAAAIGKFIGVDVELIGIITLFTVALSIAVYEALQKRNLGLIIEVLEVTIGTFGVALFAFGLVKGAVNHVKLVFVPIGLVLVGYIFWRQRKTRKKK